MDVVTSAVPPSGQGANVQPLPKIFGEGSSNPSRGCRGVAVRLSSPNDYWPPLTSFVVGMWPSLLDKKQGWIRVQPAVNPAPADFLASSFAAATFLLALRQLLFPASTTVRVNDTALGTLLIQTPLAGRPTSSRARPATTASPTTLPCWRSRVGPRLLPAGPMPNIDLRSSTPGVRG